MVRRLRRKRLSRVPAPALLVRSNQEWALDFVSDSLATGLGICVLAIMDSFTRENLSLETDTSLSSRRVTRSIGLADITRRVIGQNVWLAFGLSVVLLALAAQGILDPLKGALAQSVAVLIVVANSARILRFWNQGAPSVNRERYGNRMP